MEIQAYDEDLDEEQKQSDAGNESANIDSNKNSESDSSYSNELEISDNFSSQYVNQESSAIKKSDSNLEDQ